MSGGRCARVVRGDDLPDGRFRSCGRNLETDAERTAGLCRECLGRARQRAASDVARLTASVSQARGYAAGRELAREFRRYLDLPDGARGVDGTIDGGVALSSDIARQVLALLDPLER